jgi:hypothetical protein
MLTVLLGLAVLGAAFAADDGAIPHLVEPLAEARIDWTDLRMEATESGAHTTGAITNVETVEADARSRLGVRFLDLSRSVRVTPTLTAADVLDGGDSVAGRVGRNSATWHTVEVRYFTGGAVEVDASLGLHEWLRPALVSMARGADRTSPPTGSVTGVMIDARGLGVQASVAPTVRAVGGEVLYDAASMTPLAAGQRSPVVWAADAADARAARRAGSAPILVRAVDADGGVIIVSDADAATVRAAATEAPFLLNGMVSVVIDAK